MTMKYTSDISRCAKGGDGFTLIELLVAVAISSFVLLALGNFFISTNKTNTIQEKVAGTQQSVRVAMEIMSRDIRMAGLDPVAAAGGASSGAGFVDNGTEDKDTDADSVAIRYDNNGDGDCSDNGETVCFSYDSVNDRLMYRVSNDGGVNWHLTESLTEDGSITSMSFDYTLADGSNDPDPTANGNLADIRLIEVSICGQITGSYSDEHTDTYCFSNTIKPRNM